MESCEPVSDRGQVRGRLLIGLITAAIIVAVVGGWALPARAGGISSQYKTARASEAQGQIVLHARYAVRTDATPASAGTGSSSAGSANVNMTFGRTNAMGPVGCGVASRLSITCTSLSLK